ncbi:MAG: type IV toxin-antitoxin system AbiEi family antitoxin domain-containing protein [Chloroflexota bacterium]|nr:type IV toxin-antitoxin system AbiEi family antitoxin domain-containing protein [Chloroflexota bacterium]
MGDAADDSPIHRATARPDRARLFDVASEQGGYFTAEQARACGYSWALLSHHVKSGRFIRVRRGLYRYREYPSSSRQDVLAAWLALGKEVAVVSHDSALDLLDLSDVIPGAAHLTVPRSRRNLPELPGVRVHTTLRPFQPGDLTYRDGMVITSAMRTILDTAEAGTAPDQVERAVIQAVERGLVSPDQLRRDAAERGRRVATLIDGVLRRIPA